MTTPVFPYEKNLVSRQNPKPSGILLAKFRRLRYRWSIGKLKKTLDLSKIRKIQCSTLRFHCSAKRIFNDFRIPVRWWESTRIALFLLLFSLKIKAWKKKKKKMKNQTYFPRYSCAFRMKSSIAFSSTDSLLSSWSVVRQLSSTLIISISLSLFVLK